MKKQSRNVLLCSLVFSVVLVSVYEYNYHYDQSRHKLIRTARSVRDIWPTAVVLNDNTANLDETTIMRRNKVKEVLYRLNLFITTSISLHILLVTWYSPKKSIIYLSY